MRTSVLLAAALASSLVRAYATEPWNPPLPADLLAAYWELAKDLPTAGPRVRSARLELDYWYWYGDDGWFRRPPARRPVTTKDGKAGEVVILELPSLSMPGTDFSMAFLLVGGRVIDWASCWSYNRTVSQEVVLEDVDGDGSLDLAFRAGKGFWGLCDRRSQTRPGDKRAWLYAYAITSAGFQSLFPSKDRDLRVETSTDAAGQPVKLRIDGLPTSLREYRMCECTVSATNASDQDIPVKAGKWVRLEIEGAGYFMTFGPQDKRTVLKPGETVSQTIRLYLDGGEGRATLRCLFVPAAKP